jgi:hypothetical protein
MRRILLACATAGLLLIGCAGTGGGSAKKQPTAETGVAPAADLPQETVTEPEATAAASPEPSASPQPAAEGQGNADVLHVRAVEATDGTWTFQVTVEHPDTGWADYADGWDVVTPDGEVLKPDPSSSFTRLLLHPHENEQPFTRSQSGIAIPETVSRVQVRAHDLVDGYGGRVVWVDLTAASGEDFEVERAP